MEPLWRPPLALGPPGPARDHLHAALWLKAVIPGWDAVRETHLQLVRSLEEGSSFGRVDMARHPLRPAPEATEPADLRPRAEAWFAEWLEQWRPSAWRCRELGVVSELCEPEGAFRRRILRLLQPELERTIERARAERPPWLPWRRRRVAERRRREREQMAARLADLAASLERWTPDRPEDLVQRAELGLLRVAEGLRLAAPAALDPLATSGEGARPPSEPAVSSH